MSFSVHSLEASTKIRVFESRPPHRTFDGRRYLRWRLISRPRGVDVTNPGCPFVRPCPSSGRAPSVNESFAFFSPDSTPPTFCYGGLDYWHLLAASIFTKCPFPTHILTFLTTEFGCFTEILVYLTEYEPVPSHPNGLQTCRLEYGGGVAVCAWVECTSTLEVRKRVNTKGFSGVRGVGGGGENSPILTSSLPL